MDFLYALKEDALHNMPDNINRKKDSVIYI